MQLHSKLEWSIKAIVDDALEKWMIRQGERHGFSLAKDDNDQYKLQNSAYRWHSIKADKGIKSGFSSVDFLGDLEITDVEKFTKALFGGLGEPKLSAADLCWFAECDEKSRFEKSEWKLLNKGKQ